MAEDLPIYSDIPLRTGLQFAELERLKGIDLSTILDRADAAISALEGAAGATAARQELHTASKNELLQVHRFLFPDRKSAGEIRSTGLAPLYRGQDCVPPEFIARSLDNLMGWLNAESFSQIHPVEQCALTLTRVIDLWPFEFGNLTAAVVFANLPLLNAGLAPFFVEPQHRNELEKAVGQAMIIDMQPLVNAIFRTVKKEMEALARR
jgi:fido (protein-threonine AMPylation protein)